MITSACYCTREQVQSASDIKDSARNSDQVDRAIEAARDAVEGLLHRKFLPVTATRNFDWPNGSATSYRLWLDGNEVISVSALSSGGTAITEYFLEPQAYGPPYDRLELDRSGSGSFGQNDTPQRDISITGVWGFKNETQLAGTTVEALDASETGVEVSNSATVGVGNLILVDTEWMIVQSKELLDTTQDLASAMTAASSDTTVDVADGTQIHVGEVLTIDSEQMKIISISGNNATVKRAWGGSVLATHSLGASLYAPRNLQVARGAHGSTAATHTTSTSFYVQQVPALVQQLAVAEAQNFLQQEAGGYSASTGTGGSSNNLTGGQLDAIRTQARAQYGRHARMRSV